ncbi:hypothetical protein B0J11DRAFT_511176 [Dendryphion nanum]|uniref:Uncharacterized protein n=1 Tax=Dendryphion nanum TaxID=256645 RepID=A0A9P9D8Q5_9PLEO|nr:hypothetical protein B0J11DRAFT_511176 [Dendryphion nanum]
MSFWAHTLGLRVDWLRRPEVAVMIAVAVAAVLAQLSATPTGPPAQHLPSIVKSRSVIKRSWRGGERSIEVANQHVPLRRLISTQPVSVLLSLAGCPGNRKFCAACFGFSAHASQMRWFIARPRWWCTDTRTPLISSVQARPPIAEEDRSKAVVNASSILLLTSPSRAGSKGELRDGMETA